MATVGRSPVAPNDAIWLQDSDANRMIIHGLYVTDRIGLDEARAIFLERVVEADGGRRYPRFRQRVVRARGRWYWEEDPTFAVGRHMVRARVGEWDVGRGAWVTSEQVQEYIAAIAHLPLPADRPPWRIEYIENFEDGASAFIVRIHHAMADGVAFVPIILSLMDAVPERPAARRGRPRSLLSKAGDLLLLPVAIPAVLLERALWRADRHALHGARLGGHKRVAWTRRFPLDEVKRFKDAFGATVNDVLMALVSGAIGRYLQSSGSGAVPYIHVSMPVNMRNLDDPLAMENRFAAVPLRLPSWPLDLPRRVASVKARLDALKQGHDPLAIYSAVNLMLAALPGGVSRRLLDFFANKCTSVVTNVPGPQQPLTLGGRRLRTLMFWVPQRADIGLGISILTFGGSVQIGVISDTSVLPEPGALVAAMEREFGELARHLSGAGPSPAW